MPRALVTRVPAELLTARLRLRQWDGDDVEPLAALYAHPDVARQLPLLDRDATAAQVDRFRSHWEAHGFGVWAVDDRADGRFLGRIGLMHHPDWAEGDGPAEVEVGWALDPSVWGRGLATEGGAAAVAEAFAHLAVPRVISITRPTNLASRRVMEKLGLTRRGLATWRGFEQVWYALDRPDRAGLS